MEALERAEFIVLDTGIRSQAQNQQAYDAMATDWETTSQIIRTRLAVYFPGTSLAKQWNQYSGVVVDTYTLTSDDTFGYRKSYAEYVRGYLQHHPDQFFCGCSIDWQMLQDQSVDVSTATDLNFENVVASVRDRHLRIVKEILASKAGGYSTTFSDFIRSVLLP